MFGFIQNNRNIFFREAGYAAAQFLWGSEDGDNVVPLVVYGEKIISIQNDLKQIYTRMLLAMPKNSSRVYRFLMSIVF